MINNKQLPENYVLISLDVVNLFGNITLPLAKKILNQKWFNIEPHARGISKTTFLEIIALILNNCYVSFEGEYYKQMFGCAKGSKLSPIIAESEWNL